MNNYFNRHLYQINAYTPGEQPSGKKIIKLNTNENPYPPSPKIQKALDKFSIDSLRKYPNPTSWDLREEIAKFHGLNVDEVLITNGSDEALSILFQSCLEPSDRVILPYPTYSLYPILTELLMNESRVVKIPLKQDLHLDFDTLKKQKGKLLSFASPNAPTGVLENRVQLLDLVQNFKGIVLVDEAYIDFAVENSTLIQEIRNFDNLVVTRTFSKSYSLAGLRVGYLVSNKDNISLMYKLKDSYNVGKISQLIALEAFKDRKYFNSVIKMIIKSRVMLTKELEKLGFIVIYSQANFLFAKPTKEKAEAVFQYLREKNIFIRYFTDNISQNYIRITVGTDEENRILIQVLEKMH